MFPAATKAGGNAFAFPDTCLTPAPPAPPVPIPYPNTAMLNMANGGTCSTKVKIQNQPVVTKATLIPSSMGDEAGVNGGVMSGVNMNQCAFKLGVATVKIEGNDIVNQLKMTAHNGSSANAPAGTLVSPSQTLVLVNG